MSPNTGTFITQDVYQGSIFEPLTLHKYLYAHANPVMNSDPSGYFAVADITIATSLSNTIDVMYNSIVLSTGIGLINAIISFANGGTSVEVQQDFLKGYALGFISIYGYATLGILAQNFITARLLLISLDCFFAFNSFSAAYEAFSNEDYLIAFLSLAGGVASLFCAGNNVYSGYKMLSKYNYTYLSNNAVFARNQVVSQIQNSSKTQQSKVATVLGGFNKRTGEVVVAVKKSGAFCAEDVAVQALGGNIDDIVLTPAIRPRNNAVIPVCKYCQEKYPQSMFIEGTIFK